MTAFVLLALLAAAPPGEEAAALRHLGLAQLENERPAEAAETFRKLAALTPEDPLSQANLAVALLRLQKTEEALAAVREALKKAPGRADLLLVEGEVLQWSGEDAAALAAYGKAAQAAPDRVDVHFSLYRQASASPEGEAALGLALDALARLRPDNLVILLKTGQRAVQAGDRAGATKAYLRVRELLWQAPAPATTSLEQALAALEAGDVAAARVPGVRLENVLKPTPLYQQGLGELTTGLQGTPVERFASEPPAADFGPPVEVTFKARALAPSPAGSLAVHDFDGDGKLDLAVLTAGAVELRRGSGAPGAKVPFEGVARLLAADLDNDAVPDLLAYGPSTMRYLRGKGDGTFEDATAAWGLAGAGGLAAAVLDFDIEGDLDLVVAGERAELYRNRLAGPFEAVGKQVLPALSLSGVTAVLASDLDRDGDLDLVIAHGKGLTLLDNLRQGRFVDQTAAAGLADLGAVSAVVSADLDNDGWPELVTAGDGVRVYANRGGTFAPAPAPGLPATGAFTSLAAFDADNDGRLDLAAVGASGLAVWGQHQGWQPLAVEGSVTASVLVAGDFDGDGDLDLATGGASGLHLFDNQGGNRNHWLAVRLKALTQGNSKNNVLGLGSVLEVRNGSAYQLREADGAVVHFGLGRFARPDLLRVVWTNGVPQNRLAPQGDQRIVEEQQLKGSCPFLYAWNGERFAFVTDLLWNAPLGLPVAPGVWAGADPGEIVEVTGARADGGAYRLRLTEELWEAAFFDLVRLWIVDHPAEVEVASNLKVVPGQPQDEQVLGSRAVRPVAAAWDGRGDDVTSRVAARDEVYASGYTASPFQGIAKAWTFTFDLGEPPAAPVRLLLDGWIFPADASLNLAAAQRGDYPNVQPRLEMKTAEGWRVLLPAMGHPAGKPKTLVVDTPPLPPGVRTLRIVTSLWLAWDRIAWTTETDDAAPVVVARLVPESADLRFRGFSALVRQAPNAPHVYDYDRVSEDSPWLPFPGRYTRYGDVLPLLSELDDKNVILGPGDELALAFDAAGLPPVRPGFRRTLFLESHGWDKDADRNTFEATQVEPLPFRAMSGYPWGPGEEYPAALQTYRDEWQTREVKP